MATEWYCSVAGAESGPFSTQEVKSMARGGMLRPDDLIRKGVDGKWTPAKFAEGLAFGKAENTSAGSGSPAGKEGASPTPSRLIESLAGRHPNTARAAEHALTVLASISSRIAQSGRHRRWLAVGAGTFFLALVAVVLSLRGGRGDSTPEAKMVAERASGKETSDERTQDPAETAEDSGKVGISLSDDEGKMVVSGVVVGEPTEKQGIRLGDRLFAIGESEDAMVPVTGMTVEEVYGLFKGPAEKAVWVEWH